MRQLHWQKSSYSSEGANCVEVAQDPDNGLLRMRESEDPARELKMPATRLSVLLNATRSGKFTDI